MFQGYLVPTVFQEIFNISMKFCFAIFFSHESYRSYPSRKRACLLLRCDKRLLYIKNCSCKSGQPGKPAIRTMWSYLQTFKRSATSKSLRREKGIKRNKTWSSVSNSSFLFVFNLKFWLFLPGVPE